MNNTIDLLKSYYFEIAGCDTLYAYDGDIVVGFCAYSIDVYPFVKSFSVNDIFIHPSYRKSDSSMMLFYKIREIALKEKCTRIEASVKKANLKHMEVLKFYKKHGFEIEHETEVEYFISKILI